MNPLNTEHVGLPLGENQDKRRQLQEERRQEYNTLLSQVSLCVRRIVCLFICLFTYLLFICLFMRICSGFRHC